MGIGKNQYGQTYNFRSGTYSRPLSCISTVDGQYIDTKYLVSPTKEGRSSFFRFPREKPTKEDWILWENFWKGFCNSGRRFHQPLGHWRLPGHEIWRWFSDNVHDKIYEQSLEQFRVYELWHRSRTRSGSFYTGCWVKSTSSLSTSPR